MPAEFRRGAERIGRGEMRVYHDADGDLNVLRWKEKRVVFMLSTAELPILQEVQQRRWQGAPVRRKPSTILLYNQGKTGVDTNDQLCSYYKLERKSMKWYKKVFWRLVSMCIVNAHIVFKQATGKQVSHFMFHRDLLAELALLGNPRPVPVAIVPLIIAAAHPAAPLVAQPIVAGPAAPLEEQVVADPAAPLVGQHVFAHPAAPLVDQHIAPLAGQHIVAHPAVLPDAHHIPPAAHPLVHGRAHGAQVTRLQPGNHYPEAHPPTAKKIFPCKPCVVCSALKRKETRYRCEQCQVSLCMVPCFKLFHHHVDYKQALYRLQRVNQPAEV